LEEQINQGSSIPLSPYRVVNAETLIQLVERLRINVPSSIRESERTLADRDLILEEARDEAERIIQEATERARELVSENALVRNARAEAKQIIADGERAAQQRAEQADQYAVEVLQELAAKLSVTSQQVDNGIRMLQDSPLTSSDQGETDQ